MSLHDKNAARHTLSHTRFSTMNIDLIILNATFAPSSKARCSFIVHTMWGGGLYVFYARVYVYIIHCMASNESIVPVL